MIGELRRRGYRTLVPLKFCYRFALTTRADEKELIAQVEETGDLSGPIMVISPQRFTT